MPISPSRTSVQESSANPFVESELVEELKSTVNHNKESDYRPDESYQSEVSHRQISWKEEELSALAAVNDEIDRKYNSTTRRMR